MVVSNNDREFFGLGIQRHDPLIAVSDQQFFVLFVVNHPVWAHQVIRSADVEELLVRTVPSDSGNPPRLDFNEIQMPVFGNPGRAFDQAFPGNASSFSNPTGTKRTSFE